MRLVTGLCVRMRRRKSAMLINRVVISRRMAVGGAFGRLYNLDMHVFHCT